MKERYFTVKSHLRRNDHRLRKQLFSKYGWLQSNKESNRLHNMSKRIVETAKRSQHGIVMEDIKGLRKLFRKGTRKSRRFRRRLNSWSFYKLQKMIEYKSRWVGVPIIYVSPKQTSSRCATCGERIIECTQRKVWCPKCKTFVDRDINAARNILARGLRFKPIGPAEEAMRRNQSKKAVILEANVGQPISLSNSVGEIDRTEPPISVRPLS